MADMSLGEFAEACRRCQPDKNPQEAAALLQEAAKVADIMCALRERKRQQNSAEQIKLAQAYEIIGKLTEAADKLLQSAAPQTKPKSEITHKYGQYKHVMLTDAQYLKLVTDYGESKAAEGIKLVDEYVQQSGKTYKDYNLTVRKFLRTEKTGSVAGTSEHSYDLQKIAAYAEQHTPTI